MVLLLHTAVPITGGGKGDRINFADIWYTRHFRVWVSILINSDTFNRRIFYTTNYALLLLWLLPFFITFRNVFDRKENTKRHFKRTFSSPQLFFSFLSFQLTTNRYLIETSSVDDTTVL